MICDLSIAMRDSLVSIKGEWMVTICTKEN